MIEELNAARTKLWKNVDKDIKKAEEELVRIKAKYKWK